MRAAEAAPRQWQAEVATDIELDRLDQCLAGCALCPSPSEAHGILCGLICGGDRDAESAWLDQLRPETGDPSTMPGSEVLLALARRTRDEIEAPDLGLVLLLPDDAHPLAERALGLYDWVRGFLYAWGTLGIAETRLSAEAREVLRDFGDITRMDLDRLDDDEQSEEALTELTEFTRMAALLLYQEQGLDRGPA